ncbi:MAG TPA: hypothetical protein VFT74_14720, partial [Isosphaeraceae bacterium]|nr:hypothetical protein [Isosphaeraceae bacterium]
NNEFYDISQGFTRFVSNEDPYQHYKSPWIFPQEPPEALRPGGVGADQAPLKGAADEAGSSLGEGFQINGPRRKVTGAGTRTYVGPNGETITRGGVYGRNPDAPNIWMSANSAKGMAQAMYGGYTKVMEVRRVFGAGTHRHFSPGEPGSPQAHEWAQAWERFVNRHIRYSPVWKRMLHGASDEDLVKYLRSGEGRKMVMDRLGRPVTDANNYVQDMRAMFDQMLPTDASKLAARAGEVNADQVDGLIPHELRQGFTTDDIANMDGKGKAAWFKFVSKAYEKLGSLPNDTFVRHPLANRLFNVRMQNYIGSLPEGTKLTEKVLNTAEAEARAFANKEIGRLLYNIADESQATHMLRFLAPFFQAQMEVLNRYMRIFTDRPEQFARFMFLFNKSQTQNSLFQVVDKNGKPTDKFSHDNNVLIQVRPWMRAWVNQIPGLKHALDTQGALAIPVSSIDLIFQGDGPNIFLPSLGPVAT